MGSIDELLSASVCSILNSVSVETINDIIQALKYAGLESFSDLQFVQEEDLILVLKPIPRRKLVKAWSKLCTHSNSLVDETNFPANSLVDKTNFSANSLVDKTNFSTNSEVNETIFSTDSQVNEMYKNGLYIPPHLRNGGNRSESIMIPKFETTPFNPTCPVTHPPPPKFKSRLAAKKKKKWTHSKHLILLQVYTKYKKNLSSPNINEVDVWTKIASEVRKMSSLDCDFTQCRKKIDGLRSNYHRLKTKKNINQYTAILVNEARKAFENSENSDQTHE